MHFSSPRALLGIKASSSAASVIFEIISNTDQFYMEEIEGYRTLLIAKPLERYIQLNRDITKQQKGKAEAIKKYSSLQPYPQSAPLSPTSLYPRPTEVPMNVYYFPTPHRSLVSDKVPSKLVS